MFGLLACQRAAPPGRRFCPDAQNLALRGMCIVSETALPQWRASAHAAARAIYAKIALGLLTP